MPTASNAHQGHALQLTVDELQRYISQTVEVPAGNRMAVLLRASRANFGGALQLRLEEAPEGLELLTPSFEANQGFIPMMIHAAEDAVPGAGLVDLVAETLPDGAGVRGGLRQRTMLVRGQNNVEVWGHDATRLAVAVTEALPFSISVEQPQVPLTRLGSTEYVVRATRQEGFAEPIALRVLYNPGGVSASGSIRIEGDQTEARIPVTANHQAAMGTFPITVLAQAKARNANVWCASEFIQLDIEDSYFDFQFPKAVLTQGESGFVTVAVEVKRPPEGKVEIELVGLPAGASTEQPKIELAEGSVQANFPISLAADARVGQHKTLAVQATITRPGGVIRQTQGTGELQIVPPPPKPAAEVAVAAPPAPAAPPEKPLSRLEQLRLAQSGGEGQ